MPLISSLRFLRLGGSFPHHHIGGSPIAIASSSVAVASLTVAMSGSADKRKPSLLARLSMGRRAGDDLRFAPARHSTPEGSSNNVPPITVVCGACG